MKNLRTTIGGALAAIGTIAIQVPSPEWVALSGTAMMAVGSIVLGTSARDHKTVTQTQPTSTPQEK